MAPPPRSTIFRPVLATTSLTTSKGSPWQGSRTKLRPRDVPVFQGAAPQLFTEVATAVCDAKCLPRKELFEAWEVATRVDAKFPGVQRVADLAAGHGLLGYLLLILASSRGNLQRTAVCVDQRMPPSFDTLTDALSQRWPDLRDRMQYVEDDLANVETDPSVLVTSVHACGPLTDSVLERAVAGGAHAVAVMPCCHSLRKQPIPPVAGLNAQLLRARADTLGSAPDAIDFARIEALRLCGYEVDEPSAEIDPTVTPYNRLIIATRRGSPAPPRQQAGHVVRAAAAWRRAIDDCRPGARIARGGPPTDAATSLLPLADLAAVAARSGRKPFSSCRAIELSIWLPEERTELNEAALAILARRASAAAWRRVDTSSTVATGAASDAGSDDGGDGGDPASEFWNVPEAVAAARMAGKFAADGAANPAPTAPSGAVDDISVKLREVYHDASNGGRRACAFVVEFRSTQRELTRGEVSMWQARVREALEWWSHDDEPHRTDAAGAPACCEAFELR